MSLDEAILSVVPSAGSTWKKFEPITTELQGIEIDQSRPEEIVSYRLHYHLLRLVEEGKLRSQPA